MPRSQQDYSDAQLEYIKDLLDKLGFRGAPLKEEVVDYLIEEYCNSRSDTSDVIDWLQEQLSLRRNARPNTKDRDMVTASGLADYEFCPASYAIQCTFRVPPSIEMLEGEESHKRAELESYLQNVRRKRERQYGTLKSTDHDTQEDYVMRGDYGRLIGADVVHRGHSGSKKGPYYGPESKVVGNPDYIYKHPDGTLHVVEEKHTDHSDKTAFPFSNHIIQVTAYFRCLAGYDTEYNIGPGYLAYFRSNGHPLLYKVNNSEKNHAKLDSTLEDVMALRKGGRQTFATENAQPEKCIGCSVNAYCNHKSRQKEDLEIPYRMVRTASLP
jgi:CRISPR/Cas system-associated exonuclease Cas4 (RecB family)